MVSAPGDAAVPRAWRRADRRSPLVLVGAVVVNALVRRCMPGVGFWDTGEFQTVRPIMGTAHPTGYPTYVLLGLARQHPAHADRRAGVPDQPVRCALPSPSPPARPSLLVRRLTGSTIIGVAAGLGPRDDAGRLGERHARRPAPAPPRLRRAPALALVRWEDGRRDPSSARRAARTAGSSPRRSSSGWPPGNHSLTLLLAPPIALYVLAVEPGDPAPAAASSRRASAALGVRWCSSTSSCRSAAGSFRAPLVYGRPPRGTASGTSRSPSSSGAPWRTRSPTCRRSSTTSSSSRATSSGRSRSHPAGVPRHGPRAPRYTLLTGVGARDHVPFNAATRTPTSSATTSGRADRWTWLGILAGGVVAARPAALVAATPARATGGAAERRGARRPRRRSVVGRRRSRARCCSLADPAPDARRAPRDRVDRTATRARRALARRGPAGRRAGRRARQLVEHSTPLWYAQKVQGLRPDILIVDDRTMLDQDLGRAPDVIDAVPRRGGPSTSIRSTWRARGARRALRARARSTTGGQRPEPASWPVARRRCRDRPSRDGGRAGRARAGARRRALSYFFPAHNEAANLAASSRRRWRPCRRSPTRSRSSSSTTARRTRRRPIADELAAAHPEVVRAVHHPTNLGYGAALRSGFAAARFEHLAFTDGDRQFKVADLGRLIDAAGRGRRAGRRRRLPDPARRPAGPDASTRASTGSPTGSSSACRSATSTAPASCSGAPRSRACTSSPAARSSRPSC